MTVEERRRNIASALGSVRAEGLEPSQETITRMKQYAEGTITIEELRTFTIQSHSKPTL